MEMTNTTFLFAAPSFLSGAARILDLGATFDDYNKSWTGAEADAAALRNDFAAIGNDMRLVMKMHPVSSFK